MRLYGIYIEYESTVSLAPGAVYSMYKVDGKNCWNQNKVIVEQQARELRKTLEDKYKYVYIEVISIETTGPAK
jgi:hypothetical protein